MNATFELRARYYRALPIDDPGYEDELIRLQVNQAALVGMHCWNIGCPDGPDEDTGFCVGMGWPQATVEAGRIMVEVIRPAMDAARRAGLVVCHVESDWMDAQYPQVLSRRGPQTTELTSEEAAINARAHGVDYMEKSPLAHMRRAVVVSPVGDEPLVFYSDQLDGYLRGRGVDTLFYSGFAADMCLLGAPGGARDMLARGYRCIVLRDATVGVETPDSFPDRLHTRYALHIFQWKIGFAITSKHFIESLRQV